MEFRSPFAKDAFVMYIRREYIIPQKHYLDDAGYTSIAFVTTLAKKEYDIFKSAGYHVTDLEKVRLRDKLFNIFFISGPSNEIVEVIEVVSTR